jgi:hydroxymethylpyrimidine/phosphomethylpyrimidine kinase
MRNAALSIAGSDPSGGAGIQADLKVFALLGVYGMALPAALTAQNTVKVFSAKSRPVAAVREELDTLISDITPDALKTGMLYSAGVIATVADAARCYRLSNLVVDPVMISSSGKRLLKKDAEDALVGLLFPLALVVMPNIAEAEKLSGMEINSLKDAEEAAAIIKNLGPKNVLIKGGHLLGDPVSGWRRLANGGPVAGSPLAGGKGEAVDVLFDGKNFTRFAGRRTPKEIHGAGCVYSAAVTAGLAKGLTVQDAVGAAKKFISKAIELAEPVGRGRIPLV